MAKNSKKPLDILRKGLDMLKWQVQACKANLEAKLQQKEKLTDADEHWLDNDGNVVDKQCVLEILEAASAIMNEDLKSWMRQTGELFNSFMNLLEISVKLLAIKESIGLIVFLSEIFRIALSACFTLGPEEPFSTKPNEKEKPDPVFTHKENASLSQRIQC